MGHCPPTGARLDPEICVNPMRNMQGEIGGGRVWQLLAGSGFQCTVYNVGIMYTFLCPVDMKYLTDSRSLVLLVAHWCLRTYCTFHDQKRQNYHVI